MTYTPTFEVNNTSTRPLYEQVSNWLRQLINESFEHDARFFSERELIQMLGVSQPTVRRAIQELVNEKTLRCQVRQGIFVQKFPTLRQVGLIAPRWQSPIFMQQLNAFAEACDDQNYNLRVHYVRQGDTAQSIIRSFDADPAIERMVIWGQTTDSAQVILEELDQRGFRSVCGFPFVTDLPMDSVGVDVEAGVRLALDHLTQLGHQRIVFIINEPTKLGAMQARLNAIKREVSLRRLDQCVFLDCNSPLWSDSFKAAYEAMDQVMTMNPRPTAVVPISGQGAWAALRYAGKHGLKVPETFSVFSFADLAGSDFIFPALTGLHVDWRMIADRALDILWNDSPDQPVGNFVSVPRLITRESTGAPSPD